MAAAMKKREISAEQPGSVLSRDANRALRASLDEVRSLEVDLATAEKGERIAADARRAVEKRLDDLREERARSSSAHVSDFLGAVRAGADVSAIAKSPSPDQAEADDLKELERWSQIQNDCVDQQNETHKALETAKFDLDRQVKAAFAVGADVSGLMDGIQALQNELIGRRLALRFLCGIGFLSAPERAQVEAFLRAQPETLPGNGMDVNRHGWWNQHPVPRAYQAALERLASDPETPIPGPQQVVSLSR